MEAQCCKCFLRETRLDYDRYHDLSNRLESLRQLFSRDESGQQGVQWFDEFLSANEFEPALHTLCDFLLESEKAQCDQAVLDQIELLHQKMGIKDDCVDNLRQLLSQTGKP
jgi:hypothetical protein